MIERMRILHNLLIAFCCPTRENVESNKSACIWPIFSLIWSIYTTVLEFFILPWNKIFFLLMDLRFFFFLALLKLCLSSSPNETSVAPKEEVFSFLSELRSKINRNHSFPITSADFDKIGELRIDFPLDFMLSLVALGDIQLIYLTCLAMENYSYGYYDNFQKDLEQNPFRMNQKVYFNAAVQRIFKWFNCRILDKLRRDFSYTDSEGKKEEWNDVKKLVCAMLLVLQQLSFSTESFLELMPYYESKISPRTYIRVMTNLIENVEMDFEAGAHKTYHQLQHFSKKYDGKIPTQEPSQQKILTLINLFFFYSRQIRSWNPTSLNLDLCTPKFLALLIRSSICTPTTNEEKSVFRREIWEEIFAFFIADNIISEARGLIYWGKIFLPMALIRQFSSQFFEIKVHMINGSWGPI